MRVLVTDACGQLAHAIRRTWAVLELLMPEKSTLYLGNEAAVPQGVGASMSQAAMDCAAVTPVDRCEAEADTARRINVTGAGWLAETGDQAGALLIQVTTDDVFDVPATRPYRNDDPTTPASVCGRTKLEGERRASWCRRHLLVRTGWLNDVWGKNYFNTMLNAPSQGGAIWVVNDQREASTNCRALARQLKVASEPGRQGVVHAACGGETIWYGFAQTIFAGAQRVANLTPCTRADYPTSARRPADCVLNPSRRRGLGGDVMPDRRGGLGEVLKCKLFA